MIKHNQDGAANGVVISLVTACFFLVLAIGFGGWAFMSREDYKNHSDAKAAAAVDEAVKKESTVKDQAFAEASKSPLKLFSGPEASGSIHLEYPKTWSGYVTTGGDSTGSLEGYFAPDVVPSVTDDKSVFATRIEVTSQSYSESLQAYTSQQQSGAVTVSAYALPKLPKVTGVLVKGVLSDKTSVTMAVFPLRSQTLKVWTEGDQHVDDFNKYILPNFSFSP